MAYKNLTKLSETIHESMKRLEYGELQAEDLDVLAEDARDLYDRITILRYKVHEERMRKKNSEENLKAEIPVLFKMESKVTIENESGQIESLGRNQTSLIDAIEDLQSEVKKEVVEVQHPDMFAGLEEEEEKKEETAIEAEIKTPIKEKSKSKKADPILEESFVERHEKAPIKSLQKEINLNLKFRFINELFGNNAEEYKSFINQIDGAESKDAADTIVETDGKKKYNWDVESEEVMLFTELLERRFTTH